MAEIQALLTTLQGLGPLTLCVATIIVVCISLVPILNAINKLKNTVKKQDEETNTKIDKLEEKLIRSIEDFDIKDAIYSHYGDMFSFYKKRYYTMIVREFIYAFFKFDVTNKISNPNATLRLAMVEMSCVFVNEMIHNHFSNSVDSDADSARIDNLIKEIESHIFNYASMIMISADDKQIAFLDEFTKNKYDYSNVKKSIIATIKAGKQYKDELAKNLSNQYDVTLNKNNITSVMQRITMQK